MREASNGRRVPGDIERETSAGCVERETSAGDVEGETNVGREGGGVKGGNVTL